MFGISEMKMGYGREKCRYKDKDKWPMPGAQSASWG